jgi:hypothetical protein
VRCDIIAAHLSGFMLLCLQQAQLALLAFGRAVLFSKRVRFSALRAENRTQKIGKYYAAAGKLASSASVSQSVSERRSTTSSDEQSGNHDKP